MTEVVDMIEREIEGTDLCTCCYIVQFYSTLSVYSTDVILQYRVIDI